HAHAILPVAIERGDRALTGCERVFALTEARSAPRLSNRRAGGSEDLGDGLAVEPLIRPLDLTPDAAGSRKDFELALRGAGAVRAGRADHERGLQQVVVAAVGARSDQRLVEGQTLARDFLGWKRVARTERLGDHRRDVRQIEGLIDVVRRISAG